MLVLSRRVGERVMIGDDIVITVVEVRSDGVRLGIDAPRSVRVNRAEVLEAVRLANQQASDASDAALVSLRSLIPTRISDAATPAAPDAAPEPPVEPAP